MKISKITMFAKTSVEFHKCCVILVESCGTRDKMYSNKEDIPLSSRKLCRPGEEILIEFSMYAISCGAPLRKRIS